MNTARMFMGISVPVTGDGREAAANDARAFWLSRMVNSGDKPELPELIDPIELIKELSK
jgi:hypothetical protein